MGLQRCFATVAAPFFPLPLTLGAHWVQAGGEKTFLLRLWESSKSLTNQINLLKEMGMVYSVLREKE